MGGVELVNEALAAGFTLEFEGQRLIVHGRKDHAAVARMLIDHKIEIVDALGLDEGSCATLMPLGTCGHCGGAVGIVEHLEYVVRHDCSRPR